MPYRIPEKIAERTIWASVAPLLIGGNIIDTYFWAGLIFMGIGLLMCAVPLADAYLHSGK